MKKTVPWKNLLKKFSFSGTISFLFLEFHSSAEYILDLWSLISELLLVILIRTQATWIPHEINQLKVVCLLTIIWISGSINNSDATEMMSLSAITLLSFSCVPLEVFSASYVWHQSLEDHTNRYLMIENAANTLYTFGNLQLLTACLFKFPRILEFIRWQNC